MDMYSLSDELALRRRLLFRLHSDEARRTFEAIQTRECLAKQASNSCLIATNAEIAIFGGGSIEGEDCFVFK